MRTVVRASLAALALCAIAGTAMAQRDHFHGDIHHFRDHDMDYWRGGHWFNGPHGGRAGWWWIVGDTWYFYPAPVYPYPDPYLPPGMAPAPAPAPAPVATWYYCPNPQGYYPYVGQCSVPWQPVPAQQ
jgi:hypothetical protein